MSDDQKSTALDIISGFDASNMTEESAAEMREALHEAGIQPSADLKDILEGEGFEVPPPPGSSAGQSSTSTMPPPPPPPGSEIAASTLGEGINTFIDKYESDELSDDDIAELVSLLKEAGNSTTGFFFSQAG